MIVLRFLCWVDWLQASAELTSRNGSVHEKISHRFGSTMREGTSGHTLMVQTGLLLAQRTRSAGLRKMIGGIEVWKEEDFKFTENGSAENGQEGK